MASVTKITLSALCDIPFNKLVLSQSNVRRIKAGVSIDELAEDIARRSLLQSLNVRPVVDGDGKETRMFEVPAGGRRYRALELLVKQKRMSKTQTVPCVVRTGAIAEEDSLAENVHRENLHPLDQFRAFQTLREKGLSEEDIAARFFVSTAVVKQRLRKPDQFRRGPGRPGPLFCGCERSTARSAVGAHAPAITASAVQIKLRGPFAEFPTL
jgi:ParB/RepB/Spo0J family partition protein